MYVVVWVDQSLAAKPLQAGQVYRTQKEILDLMEREQPSSQKFNGRTWHIDRRWQHYYPAKRGAKKKPRPFPVKHIKQFSGFFWSVRAEIRQV